MADFDTISVIRIGTNLVPADIHSTELIQSIPARREVRIRYVPMRNPKQERLLHAMLKKAAAGLGKDDYESFREQMCLDIDWTTSVRNSEGKMVTIARSMSPDVGSITIAEYGRLVERAKWWLQDKHGIDPDELMRDVNEEQGEPVK